MLRAAELLYMTGAASAKEFEQNYPCVVGFSTDTSTFLEIHQACELPSLTERVYVHQTRKV
jgi:hypothetical protein